MLNFLKKKLNDVREDASFSDVLKGSAWALGARMLSFPLLMLTTALTARWYGAEAVGIVAVLLSFLTLATLFTHLGTRISILRLIPEHLVKYSVASAFRLYRKTLYLVVGASLLTRTLVYFASDLIAAGVFSKPHLSYVFALAAVFVLVKSLALLNTSAVRGLALTRVFALMQILPALTNLLLLLTLTFLFYQSANPIYAFLGSWLVTALVGLVVMERVFRARMTPDDKVEPIRTRQILSLSLPMLLTSGIAIGMGQMGVVVLGAFHDEATVGFYAVAVQLAALISLMLITFNTFIAPKFSELYHQDRLDELFRIARKSAKLMFWISLPVLLVLVLLGKPVLSLVFGEEFRTAYPALVLLAFGQLVNSASGATSHFMNMTGHEKVLRNILGVAGLLNLLLNLLLVPSLGILGAAVATMLSLSFWNLATVIYVKLRFGRTIAYLPVFGLAR